jgi:predicted nucleotidyltransferase
MDPAVVDRDLIDDICAQNDIVYLGVFGSYARGDFDPTSDVDLLVRFSKPKSLLTLVRIERELSERLGKPVDLVTEGALSPYLKDRVLAEVKSIYEES